MTFVADLTVAESDAGFAVLEATIGRVGVVPLGRGRYAVKVRVPNGAAEYAICDGDFNVVQTPVTSLADLQARFLESSAVFATGAAGNPETDRGRDVVVNGQAGQPP